VDQKLQHADRKLQTQSYFTIFPARARKNKSAR